MKLVRYTLDSRLPVTVPDHPAVHYGIIADDGQLYPTFGFLSEQITGGAVANFRLLPPCAPSKIVCVGRNYADHAKELNNPVPTEPLLFLKPPSSLNTHHGDVIYPAISANVNFEGELAFVINRRARHIPAARALDFIGGFTIVNDFTARDIQRQDVQFTRGKGFDTFCPVGPHLVPARFVAWDQLTLQTRVDGDIKQDGRTGDMLFSPSVIIEAISRVMTLEPGDLVATGTPAGVGPVLPGSIVEVSISGIGTLTSRVVKGESS